MANTISFTGINSGLDTNSIIQAMQAVEQQKLTALNAQKQALLDRQTAYRDLNTKLTALRDAAAGLSDISTLLDSKVTSGDDSIVSATAGGAALPGSYHVTIVQKASQSVLNGVADAGKGIDASAQLKDAESMGAGFKAGTFTINGTKITVSATDSLNDVLGRIETALGGSGTFQATYDAGTDKVTLRFVDSGDGPLVLGSASDTSNILSMLRLHASGATASTTSDAALGRLDTAAVLNDGGANGARARTAITPGAGEFTVNGVSIAYDTATDTLSDVLRRINNSTAGVTATYDSFSDRVVFTNKDGGAVGIHAQDVTGDFATALGLDGSATLGKNAQIAIDGVNGGNPISSPDNLFTSTETGIDGLSITVKGTSGSTDVTVAADTDAMASKFQDFVDAYNATVQFIEDKTKVSGTGTNAKAMPLHGEQNVLSLARTLRQTLGSAVAGITGAPGTLAGLGVGTTGSSPKISMDTAKLAAALQGNVEAFKTVVADPSKGILTKIVSYIDSQTRFGGGPIAQKADKLQPSIARIDDSITRFNRNLDLETQRLQTRFAAMEHAISEMKNGLSSVISQLGSVPTY
jgi:flagellar hook-associated protein 2